MKLKVPFYKQTTEMNCGPTALKMVFSYFGKEFDADLIEKEAGIKQGKAVSTIRLAIASASLGFKTKFFSKSLYFDEKNLELDFYKQHGDLDIEESKTLIKEAKIKGVELNEKTISLGELLSYLSQDSLPIVLLDWNLIIGKEKSYQGHFVPIVGYDKDSVYVHNQGFTDTRPFFKIKKERFDKARKARGTDEDILVIYRKP